MRFCIQRTKLRRFKKKTLRMKRLRIERVLNKLKIRRMNPMSRSKMRSTMNLDESQDLSTSFSSQRLMRDPER